MNDQFIVLLSESGTLPILSLCIAIVLFIGIVAFVLCVPQSAWQKDSEIPIEKWDEWTTEKENSNV